MSWFQSVQGDGFFRGFFRRPSTIILIFAIVLFVAQIPPIPGIFLMMFGASAWTGMLVAIAFVAFTMEALLGYVPRVWLALPAGLLLAYYGTVIAQRIDLDAYSRTLGPTATVDYTPGDTVLLGFRGPVGNDHDTAAGVIDRFGVPSVYVAVPRGGQSRMDLKPAEGCLAPSYEQTHGRYIFGGPDADVVRAVDVCLTEDVMLPPGRVFTATRKRAEGERSYPVTLVTTTIWQSGTARATVTGGHAQVLSWIPLFAAGCGLISGGPNAGWHCGVIPFRESVMVGPGLSAATAIGTLLGLAERS